MRTFAWTTDYYPLRTPEDLRKCALVTRSGVSIHSRVMPVKQNLRFLKYEAGTRSELQTLRFGLELYTA